MTDRRAVMMMREYHLSISISSEAKAGGGEGFNLAAILVI